MASGNITTAHRSSGIAKMMPTVSKSPPIRVAAPVLA